MRSIVTGNAGVVFIDDDDYSTIIKYTWTIVNPSGDPNKPWYAKTTINEEDRRRHVSMHRMLLRATTHERIDHVDGNGLNNCRCNLRFATHQENMRNRLKNATSKSGFKGVYLAPTKGKFIASIGHNGRSQYIGTFDDPVTAHFAYLEAAKTLWKPKDNHRVLAALPTTILDV